VANFNFSWPTYKFGCDFICAFKSAICARESSAGLIDELHYAVSPVVLGQGEAMFEGIDLRALGYAPIEQVMGERALHIVLAKGK